ncbi:phosphotransferase [Halovenus sp. WSH3]|uniref:Phosphotransferase n=1 Tax=Halovenus carboxidivorans TaxID=2692199 RepID=A0A6B0T8S6_9EURY|nr:phosphotransferase [Halovenus carboxidivorans]MXR51742.1 phosphotransferase [Halovenus carboxidivorans]
MIDTPELDGILDTVRPGATVTETERLDRGNRKQTTVVRFVDADPVVVQRSADHAAIRTEGRLLDALAERTDVPVPRPLHSGDGWLVTPLISGADLHEEFTELASGDRRRIVERFGRSLAEVHEAFEFDGWGPVSAADGTLRVDSAEREVVAGGLELATNGSTPPGDGGRYLTTYGEAAIGRLPSEFDGLKPELRSVVAGSPADSSTPRLFPWDFRPGNALVDDGELAAIVDWEGPLAAAPALSYAKAEYLVADWYVSRERAETLRSAFRRGYESVRAPPAVESAHRVAAIASTAVDSRGVVTNPGYPPVDREAAVQFHRESLRRAL